MPGRPLSAVLCFLNRLGPGLGHDAEDRQLLEQFVTHRDDAAFTVLLRRYGPLVWGVCHRVLHQDQDAEDAFQATFLILTRNARSVGKRNSLRNWLYGVALRVAVRARTQRDRNRNRLLHLAAQTKADPLVESDWAEVQPILDEEIARLPEKYQAPLILCYLEGLTHEEAGGKLGCPRGTVAVRLSRAKERLRLRLTRRGLVLSAGSLAGSLTQNFVQAAVPAVIANITLRAALTVIENGGNLTGLTASVVKLTKGVTNVMFLTKCKMLVVGLLATTLLVGTGGTFAYRALAQNDDEDFVRDPGESKRPVPRSKAGGKNGDQTSPDKMVLQKLLKERREQAHTEFKARWQEFLAGRGVWDFCHTAAIRLLKSELEIASNKSERVAACEAHLRRMTAIADIVKATHDAGRASDADHAQAQYHRLDAEVLLVRELAKE